MPLRAAHGCKPFSTFAVGTDKLRCCKSSHSQKTILRSQASYESLLRTATEAAQAGAAIVKEALDKPKNIQYKGATDLVTDVDNDSEDACIAAIKQAFADHALLGEEGGVSGDTSSGYLWCIDPLDGTTNFAHGYPSFATSVGVLHHGKPVAACVIEFAGGPHAWVTREFTASKGGGAFCNSTAIHVSDTSQLQRSLLVTGFDYDHDEPWAANMELFKHFTDVTQGEYRLKPWDVCAGVLMVQEAGGRIETMAGGNFTVFERSILASNGHLHQDILAQTSAKTEQLVQQGIDLSTWFKPDGYEATSDQSMASDNKSVV